MTSRIVDGLSEIVARLRRRPAKAVVHCVPQAGLGAHAQANLTTGNFKRRLVIDGRLVRRIEFADGEVWEGRE